MLPIYKTGGMGRVELNIDKHCKMDSSVSQFNIFCSNLTMSSFPSEIEKNIQATLWVYSSDEYPRWLPGFSFAQIGRLIWSFSRFWSFNCDWGIKWRRILYLTHPVLLQTPTPQFLAFCNDFDTRYRMFKYILLRPRPHVSAGHFWIRNFFFLDTATVHSHPANSGSESRYFFNRSPEWKK